MKTKHDIYLYDKKSLEMKRISSLWLWIPLSLLLILSLSARLLFVSDTIIVNNEGTYAISHENHFSEELLKDYIQKLNIAFPEMVFAQAKLESNNFKSRVFKVWSCRYLSNIKTKEQYLSYLGNNYAEDSMYVEKVKTLIK
jgi:hypothetical protein